MARRRRRASARKSSPAALVTRRLEAADTRDTLIGAGTAAARAWMAKEGKNLPAFGGIDPDLLYGVGLVAASKARFLGSPKTRQMLASMAKPLLYFGIAGWVRTGGYGPTDQAAGLFGVGGRPPYGWDQVVSGADEDELLEVEEGEI